MLNDVRGRADIRSSAESFVRKCVQNFPNAKIYVIPVLYNEHDLNNDWTMAMFCANLTNVIKEVLEPYGGLVCEGSRSWFHNGKQARYFPEEAGVHFNTAGYEFAQRQFDLWLEGGSGWVDYGWYDLKNGANFAKVKNEDWLKAYACRKGDIVHVHGTFSTIQMTTWDVLFTLPGWARPFRPMYITAWNGTKAFPLVVDVKGKMVVPDNITDNTILAFNGTYPIF